MEVRITGKVFHNEKDIPIMESHGENVFIIKGNNIEEIFKKLQKITINGFKDIQQPFIRVSGLKNRKRVCCN